VDYGKRYFLQIHELDKIKLESQHDACSENRRHSHKYAGASRTLSTAT
jgi:hypothetical protein